MADKNPDPAGLAAKAAASGVDVKKEYACDDVSMTWCVGEQPDDGKLGARFTEMVAKHHKEGFTMVDWKYAIAFNARFSTEVPAQVVERIVAVFSR